MVERSTLLETIFWEYDQRRGFASVAEKTAKSILPTARKRIKDVVDVYYVVFSRENKFISVRIQPWHATIQVRERS